MNEKKRQQEASGVQGWGRGAVSEASSGLKVD